MAPSHLQDTTILFKSSLLCNGYQTCSVKQEVFSMKTAYDPTNFFRHNQNIRRRLKAP
jgi:hypothetical protein